MSERDSRPGIVETLLGRPSADVFTFLVSSTPEIQEINLVFYLRGISWVEGYFPLEEEIAMGAVEEKNFPRSEILTPDFWERRLSDLKEVKLARKSPFDRQDVIEMYDDDKDDEVYLAISSRVLTPEGYMHIPLLDFDCKPTEEKLAEIKAELKSKSERGIILKSSGGYHFIGFKLLDESDWEDWVFSWNYPDVRHWWVQKHSPVDPMFIKYSLIDRENRLRLTKGLTKPKVPTVVDFV